MRTTTRFLTVPAALVAALMLAIPAAAAPQCTDTGPNTTICQTPGHAADHHVPESGVHQPVSRVGLRRNRHRPGRALDWFVTFRPSNIPPVAG